MKRFKIPGLLIIALIAGSISSFAQDIKGWQLEKMPVALETDFALSALPQHLRNNATVYLLDPASGYYVSRQGNNGFSVFVVRTEWEWAEFIPDSYTAISYDSAGSKAYMPVFFAVAAMRATGKYTPQQIKDTIIRRIKEGVYQPPYRPGISYMLCPIHRTHVGDRGLVNQTIPHYMFYAPRVDNADIGGRWDGHNPMAISSGDFLEKQYSIFNYIIIPVGEMEKAKIVEDNKDLYARLVAWKPYFKMEVSPAESMSHRH